jgi:hypothetical protein
MLDELNSTTPKRLIDRNIESFIIRFRIFETVAAEASAAPSALGEGYMTRDIIIPLLATSVLFLLTGCDQKLKEAQALGFNDAKEMEELTARGYATKDEYVDAVYRSPAFCNRGIFRLFPKLTNDSDYVIKGVMKGKGLGDGAVHEWREQHCQKGTRIVWVVKKNFDRNDYRLFGQSLEEEPRRIGDNEETEWLAQYEPVDQGYPYNLGSAEFEKRRGTWNYERGDRFYLIDAIVEYDYEGFKLDQVRIVKELNVGEVQPMLETLRSTAALKESAARAKGFQSVEIMLYSQSLGFTSEKAMLTAARKAFEEGFESVPDQRAAKEQGYLNGADYYRRLDQQQDERQRDYEQRQQAEKAEQICREHADSGKENSFLQNVCELQGYHFFN